MSQLGFAFSPPSAPTRAASAQPMRPYQEAAVAGALRSFEKWDDALWVMATGTGKTRCFTEVVHLWPEWARQLKAKSNRVLVLAERDELISQARKRIATQTGEDVGREQAEFRSSGERIVVASIQTLLRPQRLNSFRPDAFGLVIYDEVHHVCAPTRRKIVRYFQDGGCKFLGVTATPDRQDEKGMVSVFKSEEPAFCYEIDEAISDGWLVEPRPQVIRLESIDFSKVRKVNGDLAPGEIEAVIAAEEALHGIAKPCVMETGGRRALGFCPGINSSKLLAGICDRYASPGWARWMAGQGAMDVDERRSIIAAHQRGDFQGLWNCQVATEGYDDPKLGALWMARPTLSRMLFAQMVGRGTRPVFHDGFDSLRATTEERRAAIAGGVKPWLLVLEFTGNSGKHNLACTVDMMGEKYDEEVVEEAKKIVEKEGGSPGSALKRALADAETARLAAMAARARVTADVRYRVDPFELMHMKGKDDSWAKRFCGDPATEPQKRYLASFGLRHEDMKDMTKAQAIRMITTCKKREQFGKARFSQVATMRSVGIDGFNLSLKQAQDLCWEIKLAHGKRPAEEKIAAIMNRQRQPGEDG